MSGTGDEFKKLTTEVPRIFKAHKGMDFVSHWPPQMAVPPEILIKGYKMAKRSIYIYHLAYMTDNQVKQKVKLYKTEPSHSGIEQWYKDFFLKWNPDNRERLEGHPYGVWYPDSTTKTKSFTIRPIPKVLQLIYPYERGVKWEK